MQTQRSPVLPNAEWVKSSRSAGNGGACVEVARNLVDSCGFVAVRDSKNPTGPVLTVPPSHWAAFAAAVAAGKFDQ
jgi:hypothetical protein